MARIIDGVPIAMPSGILRQSCHGYSVMAYIRDDPLPKLEIIYLITNVGDLTSNVQA